MLRSSVVFASALLAACTIGNPERPGALGRAAHRLAELAARTEHAEPPAPPCAERIEALQRSGAPGFWSERWELERALTLARAKAEPVLFWREPEVDGEARAARLRRALEDGGYRALRPFFAATRQRPELARAALLREGYFYFDDPELAALLVEVIELRHLFHEAEVHLARGAHVWRLRRDAEGDYRFADGQAAGEPAHLWLYDRVWAAGADPGPMLHRSIRKLAGELGFDRARLELARPGQWVAGLRYGEDWTRALLDGDSIELELECEAIPAARAERIAAARDRARRRRRAIGQLRQAIDAQVRERLPFDEPKTEEGQQDGQLRQAWRQAYREGRSWYEFNADRYDVFDRHGRPRVPQVCIDFITDTLERASGRWWRPAGAARGRSEGRLDFARTGIENQRSVETFVNFAWSRPEWFDMAPVEPLEQFPFRRRQAFFEHLYRHRDRYLPGDIVTILGLRDDDKLHYHSFFVYDADPWTGMPTLLASNAGRPRIRNWEHELRNAPKRSLRTRLRPRLEWLESVLPERPASASPADPSDAASG